MKSMYVYILKCRDGSYYTGVTNNIESRLWQHEIGHNPTCYTYTRRPVELVYCAQFVDDPNQAIAWEKQIKGWSRKKKEALIARDWDKLKEYAKCLNKTSHKNYKKEEHGD